MITTSLETKNQYRLRSPNRFGLIFFEKKAITIAITFEIVKSISNRG